MPLNIGLILDKTQLKREQDDLALTTKLEDLELLRQYNLKNEYKKIADQFELQRIVLSDPDYAKNIMRKNQVQTNLEMVETKLEEKLEEKIDLSKIDNTNQLTSIKDDVVIKDKIETVEPPLLEVLKDKDTVLKKIITMEFSDRKNAIKNLMKDYTPFLKYNKNDVFFKNDNFYFKNNNKGADIKVLSIPDLIRKNIGTGIKPVSKDYVKNIGTVHNLSGNALRRGHIKVYKSGSNSMVLSKDNCSPLLLKMIKQIQSEKTIDTDDYLNLAKDEKLTMDGLINLLKMDVQFQKEIDADTYKLRKRFEILSGELDAGNTSKGVVNEMKHIIFELKRTKMITISKFNHLKKILDNM